MGALLFFCLRWRLGWVPVERAWESGGGEREWRDSQPLLLMLLLLRIQQQNLHGNGLGALYVGLRGGEGE